jgi:hypothetical protein
VVAPRRRGTLSDGLEDQEEIGLPSTKVLLSASSAEVSATKYRCFQLSHDIEVQALGRDVSRQLATSTLVPGPLAQPGISPYLIMDQCLLPKTLLPWFEGHTT